MSSCENSVRTCFAILILNAFLGVVSGVCDSPWVELDGACYYLSPSAISLEVASWHQSHDWCLQNGGNLVTIEDIEERRLITGLTQEGRYDGAMWIGLNRLADGVNYKWIDGSTAEFRDWAMGQPSDASNGMCAFQKTHPLEGCYTHDPGISTIEGLFDFPQSDNPPFTFYFDYLGGLSDQEGSAECQSLCAAQPFCVSYTFISNSCPDVSWKGECMGRSNQFNVSVPSQWAISGVKYTCNESGLWYVSNCGESRGFICKKADNSTSTVSPPTTPAVPGFCPAGYIDGGGNKCFKIVVKTDVDGVNWTAAVDLCRAEPGIVPDLASILSEYETAAITMHLRNEYFGFWIGLRFETQWLWSDNLDVSYFNWAPGEPWDTEYDRCTELWTNPGPAGTWNNEECSVKRGYICQTYKDANSIISTPPVTPEHGCKADSGYYSYGGICYRKITTVSSWSAALATCEAEGATLATIHSEAENAALYVFASDIAPFWIGYHTDGSNEWVWTDGWPDIYSNWNAGEEPGTGGGCASFKDTGKWKDDQCTNNLTAICMISTATVPTTPTPVDGLCPVDWVAYGSDCYFFSPYYDELKWDIAVDECNDRAGLYAVGNLASVHSAVDNHFIYEHLKAIDVRSAWIGLHKLTQGSPYEWSDGTALQYTHWAPGEPSDKDGLRQCVEMHVDAWPGMWNDELCDEYRSYICKVPKLTRPTTPPGPSCPSECGWSTYETYCIYADFLQTLTFTEAQDACVSVAGTNAHLVTVPDAATNLYLRKMVKDKSQGWAPVWIGLTRPSAGEPFSWMDNTELNFTNWAPGQPTNGSEELCADMHNREGQWSDINCATNRLHYICQINREHLPLMLSTNVAEYIPPSTTVEEYLSPPTTTSKALDASNNNDGIYLTSGELAGVILGTMFGTILMIAIGMILYSVVRRRSPPAAQRQLVQMESTNDAELPPYEYNMACEGGFQDQPPQAIFNDELFTSKQIKM